MLKESIQTVSLAAILSIGFIAPANATLVYNTFTHAGTDTVNYEVTIDHDMIDGEFDITYKVLPVPVSSPNTVGKLTGFFFDMGPIDTTSLPDPDSTDPYADLTALGLTNENNPSGTSICGSAFGDVKQVKGSCGSRLNLGTTFIGGVDYAGFLFDVGLGWKKNDLTSGNAGSFSIADAGLNLNDWGAIGIRGQATGPTGGNGSAKEFQLIGIANTTTTAAVPEPSLIALFGMGLLGIRLTNIRRNRKAS